MMKNLLLLLFALCSSLVAQDIQRLIAIDNVCAWPNLTLLPDGSINSTIFGQPSHGQMPGATAEAGSLGRSAAFPHRTSRTRIA